MTARPRVLADTEVLVRAAISAGAGRELVQRASIRDISLCTSTAILDELDEVLARPKFRFSPAERRAVRRLILASADVVAVFDESEATQPAVDPGDAHVVEAAVRTRADLVVSSDAGLAASIGDVPVLPAGEALRWCRARLPSGEWHRLGALEIERQRAALGDTGADEELRRLTNALIRTNRSPRVATLDGPGAAALLIEVVRACGSGVVADLRSGGSFDYVSGVRIDLPSDGRPPVIDVSWYSSDRPHADALLDPDAPTTADFGWMDDHRARVVMAAAQVIVVDARGPRGEPDVRFVSLVSEPLPFVPAPDPNRFRRVATYPGEDAVAVTDVDPADFTSRLNVWLRGGPAIVLSTTAPSALDRVFDLCDSAAADAGLPLPS